MESHFNEDLIKDTLRKGKWDTALLYKVNLDKI